MKFWYRPLEIILWPIRQLNSFFSFHKNTTKLNMSQICFKVLINNIKIVRDSLIKQQIKSQQSFFFLIFRFLNSLKFLFWKIQKLKHCAIYRLEFLQCIPLICILYLTHCYFHYFYFLFYLFMFIYNVYINHCFSLFIVCKNMLIFILL